MVNRNIRDKEIMALLGAGKIYKILSLSKSYCEARFILFDDGKTIMELTEEDDYSYHDHSFSARELYVFQDEVRWKELDIEENNIPATCLT